MPVSRTRVSHLSRRTLLALSLALAGSATWAQAFPITTSGTVVLYTTNNAQSVDAVKEAAKKLMPNVRINVITGGSGQLLKRMEAESAKPQADVFWTSSANVLAHSSSSTSRTNPPRPQPSPPHCPTQTACGQRPTPTSWWPCSTPIA